MSLGLKRRLHSSVQKSVSFVSTVYVLFEKCNQSENKLTYSVAPLFKKKDPSKVPLRRIIS